MADSAEQLERVLAILEARKLRVSGLVVGDVRIMFAEPTGLSAAKVKSLPADKKGLEGMRRRYRNLFGRDPSSDQELQELEGVL